MTYNDAKYLKQCINSVKRQDYDNLEIIAIADKSDDGTAAILLDEAPKSWHVVCNQERQGTAKNFDMGIDYLRDKNCEYIVDFCGDDVMAPNRVSTLAKTLDEADRNTVVAYDGFYILMHDRRRPIIRRVVPREFCPDELVTNNFIGGVSMFKLDAFDKYVKKFGFDGYYENGEHAEDYWCWLQMLTLAGKDAKPVYEPLWVYRNYPEQKSAKRGETTRCRLMVQAMAVKELRKRNVSS